MVERKAICHDRWIYPKKFTRSRICRDDNKCKEFCDRDNREDSKLRGSSRQNKYLLLTEEEEEEEVEESLGSLVVKKKTKKKKNEKKKKKRKLDGGAASNFFVAASNFNFFERPLKASGVERKSTNMPRCETRTEKGENGGGM